jgi:hypothetical protein
MMLLTKHILIFVTVMVVVEVAMYVMAIISLGNGTSSMPTAPAENYSLYCGLIIKNHVGAWYCPITLAML